MASPQIDNRNASAVQQWIKERTKAKTFKPCAHLVMRTTKHQIRGQGVTSTNIRFIPDCQRRSFLWKQDLGSIEMEREYLAFYNGFDLISCPADCRFYRRAWVSRILLFMPTVYKLFVSHILKPVFEAFAKLNGAVQILLILMLLILFSPKWVPVFIELAKAIHGK